MSSQARLANPTATFTLIEELANHPNILIDAQF